MQKTNILYKTQPGPLTSHLMHEYQHIKNYKMNSLMFFDDSNEYVISKEIPSKGTFETFSYDLFGLSLNKIYLVKLN